VFCFVLFCFFDLMIWIYSILFSYLSWIDCLIGDWWLMDFCVWKW
jgi:hypothetical protein